MGKGGRPRRVRVIITLLSDFGAGGGYPAAMKGVILGLTGAADVDVELIDLSHEVPRHDIRAGAFLLWSAVPYFPEGTIHLAVVDPGVGTERRGLIVAAGGQHLVGPDNGLLIPAAERLGLEGVYQITERSYWLPQVSTTFHGRDIFAPVAAHLARGVPPEELGKRLEDQSWVVLSFGEGRWNRGGELLIGEVIYIDPFGNVITNIPDELAQKLPWGASLKLRAKPKVKGKVKVKARARGSGRTWQLRFLQTYAEAEEGELLLLIGSHGLVELAVNQGSAAEALGLQPGDRLEIELK